MHNKPDFRQQGRQPLQISEDVYKRQMQHSTEGITDDAMVVEQEMGIASVMVKGGYENIKITTPEDLLVAESFLAEK